MGIKYRYTFIGLELHGNVIFYVHSQVLSILIIECIHDSDSQFKSKPAEGNPNEPKEMKSNH